MTIGKKLKKALSENFNVAHKHCVLTTGEIVRILREKNELSQNALAKLTGMTQATISSIESDRVSIGIERAKVLAAALKVHPAVIAFPDWNSEDIAA